MAGHQRDAGRVKSSQNILLRKLSVSDQGLLEPNLQEIQVSRGAMILKPGDEFDNILFPESAVFSLVENVGSYKFAEIAMVGREGMLGWPALLSCGNSTHAAICQSRGGILSIPYRNVMAACEQSSTLKAALLRFVHTIIVQMARAIASHLQDCLDQRLARWLLMRHDRAGGDVLVVRHDEIATWLNIRRASVTDHLHVLEGDRLIRCNRGKILIRDRCGLEVCAGESYGVVEQHYRNLIAPFGKSQEARR